MGKKTVLVVDDEKNIRLTFSETMTQMDLTPGRRRMVKRR